jgi:hypothetical protein
MFFPRRTFEIVQSFHLRFCFLATRRHHRHTFYARQSFTDQNLAQTFSVYLNNDVISALAAAASGCRPTRPDYEWFLQKLFRALLCFFAGLHRFVERDAEVQTLIVRSIALPKVGLGRVDVIKPRGKFFVACANMEAVTVVVGIFEITTIRELDPFFFIARRCRMQKRGEQEKCSSQSRDHSSSVGKRILPYNFSVCRECPAKQSASKAMKIARSTAMCCQNFQC